jgi:hypothetical protein
MLTTAICRAAEAGTGADDLPLTDPRHPLHRADVVKTETPAAPKAKASGVTRKAKEAKAPKTKKATASAKKPHEPSKIVSTEDNPSKSIVPGKFKVLYAAHGGTNGDNVAVALKAAETINSEGRPSLDWDTMLTIAKANDIDLSAYAHLNPGQKRMNLGNKLRGMVKSGKTVVIGKKRIATLKAADAVEQKAAA